MSEENKTLNKGLDALLGQSNTNQRSVKEIEISKIKPGRFQPRSNFDNEKLQELTESIKKQGVLSPILVRELGLNEYEVIAGERRLRSSKMAGLGTIPCLVDQKKDQDALVSALIENLQSLFCASGTLIPLQCEYYSLEGVTGLMNTIETISNKNMSSNRILGIVRTMVDMRNNLAKEVSDELEKHFESLVFNTLIPRNVKLAEAPSHGISGIKYKPDSYGARAYLALAGELIRKVEYV